MGGVLVVKLYGNKCKRYHAIIKHTSVSLLYKEHVDDSVWALKYE